MAFLSVNILEIGLFGNSFWQQFMTSPSQLGQRFISIMFLEIFTFPSPYFLFFFSSVISVYTFSYIISFYTFSSKTYIANLQSSSQYLLCLLGQSLQRFFAQKYICVEKYMCVKRFSWLFKIFRKILIFKIFRKILILLSLDPVTGS